MPRFDSDSANLDSSIAMLQVNILLTEGYSNMVLACLLEPLRAARNHINGVLNWSILSLDNQAVCSSSGLVISPNLPWSQAPDADLLVVLSGYGFRDHAQCDGFRTVIHQLCEHSTQVLGADTGAWLLACAGLLQDRKATAHWQILDEFAETYPNIQVVSQRWVADGRWCSCGSASTALAFMLEYIEQHLGPAAAFEVSTIFLHDADRDHRLGHGHDYLQGKGSDALRRALHVMVETLENPLPLDDLAMRCFLSPRSLHRLFANELSTSPTRYYQYLRLSRAQDLLRSTTLSLREISLRCGYSTPAAMAKAFRMQFGTSPGQVRRSSLG